MTRAERNAAKIAGLHPEFAPLVSTWLEKAEHEGFEPLIVQGRRTFAEQSALYAQGRFGDTRPRVTNAVAGKSYHNFGLAIDFVDVKGGTLADTYDEADWKATDYERLAQLGRQLGMDWGGLWATFKDLPHLEWHPTYGASEAMVLSKWTNPPGFLPAAFFSGRV